MRLARFSPRVVVMTAALSFLGALALAPRLSASSIPYPPLSTIGTAVVLGGTRGGAADPAVGKTIVLRTIIDAPIPGATVTLDFSSCTAADIRLCSEQPDPGVAVSCGGHVVTAIADDNGQATFDLVGYAVNPGGGKAGAPAAGFGRNGCVVKGNGVVVGFLDVATLDQNGSGGADYVDLALVVNDRFSLGPGEDRGRSDFDGNGRVDSVDLALWLKLRAAGGSTQSCGAACP